MRLALLSLVMLLGGGVLSGAQTETSNSAAWIVPAQIYKNAERSGSGVYFRAGVVITAAHLTSADAEMGVRIAGTALPAKVLKQGLFEEVDLTLLTIDKEKLSARVSAIDIPLCEAPPWPGDPVIVVDAERAARSRIISSEILSFSWRSRFSTLIADVATTGNSGSGVFNPDQKCLLGIMSRKFMVGGKDVAKYFVPASEIRDFLPDELRSTDKHKLWR